jgi:hypothetical protein
VFPDDGVIMPKHVEVIVNVLSYLLCVHLVGNAKEKKTYLNALYGSHSKQ